MDLLEFKKFKIDIHPLFIAVIIISIALDYIEQFFILFFVVTIHELAHIVTAKIFKLEILKVVIYPFGEMAIISNLLNLNKLKSLLIILAGPVVNLLMAISIYILKNDKYNFLMMTNLSVAVFNLLPIYPLDGGRLLHLSIDKYFGFINANKIVIKVSKFIIYIMIFLGFLQVCLYPYNLSIICISIFLKQAVKKEEINLYIELIKNICYKSTFINRNLDMYTKNIIVYESTKVKEMIKFLRNSYICKFEILDKNSIKINEIYEMELLNSILKDGISQTAKSICINRQKS